MGAIVLNVRIARLDFKVWSNKTSARYLGCLMVADISSPRSVRIGLLHDATPPIDYGIDFSRSGLDGQIFSLEVGKSANGKIKWLSTEFDEEL